VWSLRAQDADDAALDLIGHALQRDPDNLGLVMEKASLLHERGDDPGALDLLNGRIGRAGSADFTWQAWFLQAMLFEGMGQWDKAEEAINKALALDSKRPEVLNFLGYGWINRGVKIDEGMELVRQALAVNPKSGAMMDSLGWGYYRKGDYEQALAYIEQAIQLSPSDAEINEHLGDVYMALGRDIEARYEWQRVLTLKPSDKQVAAVRQKLQGPETVQAAVETATDAAVQVTALNEKTTKPQ
jgi:tetratricopeptide (TPR) repeat protein